MAIDSIKSSVSDHKGKKKDLKKQQEELVVEFSKLETLRQGALNLEQNVQDELGEVKDCFDIHENELIEDGKQLEKEKLDIKDQINKELTKLSSVKEKIEGMSGNKYAKRLETVSEKTKSLLDELDKLKSELESEYGIAGVTDSGGKTHNIVKIDGDSYRVDDDGKPHMKRGEDKEYHVLPNTKYVVNGYTYQSDENGRIIHVEGNLSTKDGERASLNAKVSDMGVDDQRGHIIADILCGSNQNDNLIAQLQSINQGSYKILESSLVDLIDAKNQVYGNYSIEYSDASSRPSAITVNYSINDGASISQVNTFKKLGLKDIESLSEFENNLMDMCENGYKIDCNYSVVFSNSQETCWLFVEYTLDGGYPILAQFV